MSTTRSSAPGLAELMKQRQAADTARAELDAAIRAADTQRSDAERVACVTTLEDYLTTESSRLIRAEEDAARALADAENAEVLDVQAVFSAWLSQQMAHAELNAGDSAAKSHLDNLNPFDGGQPRMRRGNGFYGNRNLVPSFTDYLTDLGRNRILAADTRGQEAVHGRIADARAAVNAKFGVK